MLLHRYNMIQMSKAVVMQAASVAICRKRSVMNRMRNWKEEYQEKSRYLRPRFSPGYGDFPAECQKQIAPALELGKRIGVTLTDSSLHGTIQISDGGHRCEPPAKKLYGAGL